MPQHPPILLLEYELSQETAFFQGGIQWTAPLCKSDSCMGSFLMEVWSCRSPTNSSVRGLSPGQLCLSLPKKDSSCKGRKHRTESKHLLPGIPCKPLAGLKLQANQLLRNNCGLFCRSRHKLVNEKPHGIFVSLYNLPFWLRETVLAHEIDIRIRFDTFVPSKSEIGC